MSSEEFFIPTGLCKIHNAFTPCAQCAESGSSQTSVEVQKCKIHYEKLPCSRCVETQESVKGDVTEQKSEMWNPSDYTTEELFEHPVEFRINVIREMMVEGIRPNRRRPDEDKNGYSQDAAEALATDQALFELYRETFLEGKQKKIKEKTTRQREAVSKYFLEQESDDVVEKMDKYEKFKAFSDSLVPMVSDNNRGITDFKSPRVLGLRRGDGGYDTPVQGGAYVYGSFDKLPHEMAQAQSGSMDAGLPYREWAENVNSKETDFNKLTPEQARTRGQRRLDENDIAERALVNMADISEVNVISKRFDVPAIKMYLDNSFDYQGGKELLAYYLASAFETPEEAKYFFTETEKMKAEEWGKKEPDFSRLARMYEEIPEDRLRSIYDKTYDMYNKFGIIPPLQLEVRVRDSAKIQEGW